MAGANVTGRSDFQSELAKQRYIKRDQIERLLERKKARKEIQETKRKKFLQVTNGVPAKVVRVNIDGLRSTKDSVVVDAVADIFKVQNYHDLVRRTKAVHSKMKKLGCFSNVDVFIDTVNFGEEKGGLEVTFTVVELGNWYNNLSVHATDNEAHVVLEGGVPNVCGRGEKMEGSLSYGWHGTSTQKLAFVCPTRNLLGSGDPKASTISAYIFHLGQDFPWSGLSTKTNALGIEALFTPLSWLRQTVRWQLDWRQLCPGQFNRVPFESREVCGHSLKSALLHKLAVDTRDDTILPTSGIALSVSQELSGLGGNVLYFKSILDSSLHFKLTNSTSLSFSGSAGLLSPLRRTPFGPPQASLSVLDTFTLGGPQCLRGYAPSGIVPLNSPLGGRAYWRVGSQVYFTLPYLRGNTWMSENVRGHLFAEAGSVGNPRHGALRSIVRENWVSQYRMTYGIGLVFRLSSFARAELNYCFPFFAQLQDRTGSGLQFGIGLNFA